jgi:hypothetical protein
MKNETYYEYDHEKYLIEKVTTSTSPVKTMTVIRRILTNEIIGVLTDEDIRFIVQSNESEATNFIVSSYVDGKNKLSHFVDFGDQLVLKNEFISETMDIKKNRLTNSSFIISQSDYSYIYNLDKKSDNYDYIYNDERISNKLNNNAVMVKQKLTSYYNEFVSDTIYYGINPETFDIVTPIWSELQQRLIDVYTDQKVLELANKRFDQSLSEITISNEIVKYLDILGKYLDKPNEIYLDNFEGEINTNFVKKFIKK